MKGQSWVLTEWQWVTCLCGIYCQTPVIPATVTDQIRLWELERDRFKFMEGVLYDQFLSQSDFELLRDYAKVSHDYHLLVQVVGSGYCTLYTPESITRGMNIKIIFFVVK